MADLNNADGVKPADGQKSSHADGDDKSKQLVSYDTYDKAMASLNKEKQRAKELEAQLQKIQEEKMVAEGNKDALIDTYRKKAEALEEATKREKAERILDRFNSKIAEVALKKGFKNPGVAQKLFSIKDFSLDDGGGVDETQLESKFDQLRTTDSYLFSQADKKIADGNPMSRPASGNTDMSKMTIKELEDLYIQKSLKG